MPAPGDAHNDQHHDSSDDETVMHADSPGVSDRRTCYAGSAAIPSGSAGSRWTQPLRGERSRRREMRSQPVRQADRLEKRCIARIARCRSLMPASGSARRPRDHAARSAPSRAPRMLSARPSVGATIARSGRARRDQVPEDDARSALVALSHVQLSSTTSLLRKPIRKKTCAISQNHRRVRRRNGCAQIDHRPMRPMVARLRSRDSGMVRQAPGQARADHARDVCAHLLRARRHARHRATVLLHRCQIAGHEDALVPRYAEVRRHAHAAGAIEHDAERPRQRRRCHTGGPQHRPADSRRSPSR